MDASVALAAAYLRCNGYFVLAELPVQVEDHGFRSATDIDLLAVRLPHAAETVPHAGARAHDLLLGLDPALGLRDGETDILVAEVKRGRARLNPGLGDPRALRFALRRTGCCDPTDIPTHAVDLARRGEVETAMPGGHRCRVRLASIAGRDHVLLPPRTLMVSLAHCEGFIRARLYDYREALRGAYYEDPVLNLLALLLDIERESARIAQGASA